MAANYVKGTPAAQQGATDYYDIMRLGSAEEARKRKILEEQKGIQSTRLSDLAKLLAQQQNDTFNGDIPEIANTAQGKGFLETSGFGNALADRYQTLTEDTSLAIAKQGLADRDFEVGSIGDISSGTGDLNTSALQRKFSVADNAKSEALARELAKYGVAAPAAQPSTMDKALQYAGPILSGVGSVKGAS